MSSMKAAQAIMAAATIMLIAALSSGCQTFADSFKAAAVEAARTASEKGLEMGRDLAEKKVDEIRDGVGVYVADKIDEWEDRASVAAVDKKDEVVEGLVERLEEMKGELAARKEPVTLVDGTVVAGKGGGVVDTVKSWSVEGLLGILALIAAKENRRKAKVSQKQYEAGLLAKQPA